jgi:hypothetical protein
MDMHTITYAYPYICRKYHPISRTHRPHPVPQPRMTRKSPHCRSRPSLSSSTHLVAHLLLTVNKPCGRSVPRLLDDSQPQLPLDWGTNVRPYLSHDWMGGSKTPPEGEIMSISLLLCFVVCVALSLLVICTKASILSSRSQTCNQLLYVSKHQNGH